MSFNTNDLPYTYTSTNGNSIVTINSDIPLNITPNSLNSGLRITDSGNSRPGLSTRALDPRKHEQEHQDPGLVPQFQELRDVHDNNSFESKF
jgi:hypothetical protein